ARQSRQVIARGPIERISQEESYEYFSTRSRGSRIGAWASRQSSVIPDRAVLEERLEELNARFPNEDVPLPEFWGGYRLRPETVEFWQGQANRLHDRFEYRRDSAGGWTILRLSP
ncbi:MAG: pyridoxal 5'-phosphate synthase, partial [Gammaproteobacteria bacterium]